jgi:hypothetical protein
MCNGHIVVTGPKVFKKNKKITTFGHFSIVCAQNGKKLAFLIFFEK